MRQIRSVRTIMALALALALLGAPGAQAAELYFEGKVAGGETLSVLAPYGGIVEEMAVSVGERIEQGDLIAKLATTKEFAPVEGRVAGVFGQPGDNTESVTERYGAVLFIEPLHKYTISADTSKAYNSNQNRVIHTGEVVYLSCTSDGTHQGVGVVTKVENSSYTVEVTAGEFYLEETVNIYRKPDYDSKSRIGRGGGEGHGQHFEDARSDGGFRRARTTAVRERERHAGWPVRARERNPLGSLRHRHRRGRGHGRERG